MSLNLDKSRWTRVKFGEVVFNVNSTVRDAEAAGIDRVIAMDHLDPGELRVQRWGTVEDGTTFTRRVKPGQTLFGKRRAYQRKVAFAEFDAICSGDILTFQANEARMLPEFLPFLVQSDGFFAHALGTSAGSLSPRTNWTDLSDFEFDLPPLEEQKRLADLLWTIQSHREQLSKRAGSLSHTDNFWTFKSLRDLIWSRSLSDLIDSSRPLCYGVVQPGENIEKGNRLLRVMDLESGNPKIELLKKISDEVDMQYRRSKVKPGDILLSIVGTIGRSWIVTEEFSDCNIARALARISPNYSLVRSEFLHWVLSSEIVRENLISSSFESARKTLNLSALAKIKLPEVSLEEQDKLIEQRKSFLSGIERNKIETEATFTLASSVIADIFGSHA